MSYNLLLAGVGYLFVIEKLGTSLFLSNKQRVLTEKHFNKQLPISRLGIAGTCEITNKSIIGKTAPYTLYFNQVFNLVV